MFKSIFSFLFNLLLSYSKAFFTPLSLKNFGFFINFLYNLEFLFNFTISLDFTIELFVYLFNFTIYHLQNIEPHNNLL